jgi:uncharacterized protein YciI
MALFAVIFEDDPAKLSVREKLMGPHIAWLDKHQALVLVGGSLRAGAEAAPVGGLWIVEAESAAEVEALYKTDPFWTEGLRAKATVREWRKAFPDRKVPV